MLPSFAILKGGEGCSRRWFMGSFSACAVAAVANRSGWSIDPDEAAYDRTLKQIASMPPLVFAGEAQRLRRAQRHTLAIRARPLLSPSFSCSFGCSSDCY